MRLSFEHHYEFDSMGTRWRISIADNISHTQAKKVFAKVVNAATIFDQTYSRFIKSSLIWEIAQKTGVVEVPAELVEILNLYIPLNIYTSGRINPLIGHTISDLGYDADYKLTKQDVIRETQELPTALKIIDETHIEIIKESLIDIGALGKGYFVDKTVKILSEAGIREFLVDGSGDIFYHGNNMIVAGLEHPDNPKKVIGQIQLSQGAFCASAVNRRQWGNYHHIIDPQKLMSPKDILASWVIADSTAIADGLATALFLSKPEKLQEYYKFEYCLLNTDLRVKYSKGFNAEFF